MNHEPTSAKDARDKHAGHMLIQLLHLHVKGNGRVDTDWGDKTPTGLARTVRRILEDSP